MFIEGFVTSKLAMRKLQVLSQVLLILSVGKNFIVEVMNYRVVFGRG